MHQKQEIPISRNEPMRESAQRILVVDDEPIIVSFLKQILDVDSTEYQIETARSGAEAISKARQLRPHTVVLDINIPEGDGFDVCAQVRAMPECAHTIVLAMTSQAEPERVRRITQAGAVECLRKPFPLREFLEKVREYSRQARLREQQDD